jgi:hypothetical protein
MSEDNVDTGDQTAAGQSPDADNKTYTQEQVESIIKGRLPEYHSLKEKAEQFDALTASAQTAEETLADWKSKAEAAESELAWRETLLLRQELAAQKNLDQRLWSRIRGETREEIEADIGELQGFSVPSRRPASLKSGASNDQQTTAKERAAQALRMSREAR